MTLAPSELDRKEAVLDLTLPEEERVGCTSIE